MPASPTPDPTIDELLKAFRKNKDIMKCLNDIMTLFIESYRTGHKGTNKMVAYTRTNQVVAVLDIHMVNKFNELTYGKR